MTTFLPESRMTLVTLLPSNTLASVLYPVYPQIEKVLSLT
jgi:hypothetical protein